PRSSLSVNDAHAIYRFAKAGAGLGIVPDFLAASDVSAGTMSHVLPDWHLESVGVYAVWPPNAPKAGLTASFVEALAKSQTLS
ncbi:MAG: LysR substrate-binding domain-containing protein, partial [Pseudomonadota bacterium]